MPAPSGGLWAWLGLLWALLGLACRPTESPWQLDEPPVPEATVVARLDPDGVPPWSQGPPLSEPRPPRIVDVGPEGDVGVYPRVFVRFDQSIEPPAEGAAPLIRLEPEVPGTIRWPDRYQAIFSPSHSLEPGQSYDVVVEGRLSTADGESVDVSRRWTLAVGRPRVDLFVVDDRDYPYTLSDGEAPLTHWKANLVVSLDRPGTLQALRDALQVVGKPPEDLRAKGRPLPSRVRRTTERERKRWGWDDWRDERELFVIEPVDHWPADTMVEVTVGSSFKAMDDTLTLGTPKVTRLRTEPGLGVKLHCDVEYEDGCDPGPLSLQLDNAITRRQLSKISVSPRPARFKVKPTDRYGGGITSVIIEGRYQPGQAYTVSIPESFRDVHGQTLPEAFSEEVSFVLPPPSLALSDRRGFLPADGGTTVGLEARSLTRARLRVAVLGDDAAVARASLRVDEGGFPTEDVEVIEQELDLDPQGRFEWSSIALDLTTFTKGRRRPVFVEVTPLALTTAAAGRPVPDPVRGLFQVTDLGAFAMISSSRSVARVTSLGTGEPKSGVEVQLLRASDTLPVAPLGEVSLTGADGLAPLPSSGEIESPETVLRVRDEATDDRFVMDLEWLSREADGPEGYRNGERVLTTVVTERPLYRPGETVHVVGWAAVSTPHTPSGLRPVPAKSPVRITLEDHAGDVVLRRKVAIKEYGKYWATMKLPEGARLGSYRVRAEVAEASDVAGIRLRQFRTPPFSVDAAIDLGDVVHGQSPNIAANASYYFGGQVPISRARRFEECRPTSFRPPGIEPKWVVGRSTKELPYHGTMRSTVPHDPADEGRVRYSIDLSRFDATWSYRCTANLSIQDAGAAEVGAEVGFWLHPSRYLMIGSPLRRIEEGDTVVLPLRATTHAADRVADVPVKVKVTREFWAKDAKGIWQERTKTLKGCSVRTTAEGDDPVCRLPKLGRGYYTIEATTADDGPEARVRLSMWVGSRWRPVRREPTEGLSLELSDPEPRPGDRVTVTVRSPDDSARGVLVLMHGGLRTVEPFQLKGGEHVHPFTVGDTWVPTVEIEAVLVHRATADDARDKDLIEHDSVEARVTPEHRALRVEVNAPDVAGPRTEIPIELSLHDAAGEPVAGHVALWAVDEAILSLAEPVIPDLVEAFVVDRGTETELHDDFDERLFPYVVRSDPYRFGWESGYGYGTGAGFGGHGRGGGGGAAGGTPVARKDFEPTPIFLGDVEVGANGRATVMGTLPDDLTTFRITAIASALLEDGDAIGRFGHADTRVRVTAPLVLQPVLPRHLRPGDIAEAAALVDNLGGPSGTVTLIVEVQDEDGALRLTTSPTVVEHVEAGGQIRIPFGLQALGEGRATVRVTATLAADAGDVRLADAVELPVPVEVEPSVVRQVAVQGSVADDEPLAIALRRPLPATAGEGGVDVALSSTLLGGAEDMVEGLVDYPYGCVEQTSSRLLPLAALGAMAEHYPLGVGDLRAFVRTGVTRLRGMQTHDGGLGYWPGDETPHAYATAYATWVLVQVRDAGYRVPQRFLDDLRDYLADRVDAWSSHGTPDVGDDVRLAMALVALAELDEELGKGPGDALSALVDRRSSLPTFTKAMALLALQRSAPADPRVTTMAEELLDGLDERSAFAHVRDGGGWLGMFFDSGPRTEAMVLLALLHAAPDDRRVEKLARGLMELRRAGALRNTQERAYALLALAEYAERYEAEVPDFDAHVWVNADHAGHGRFEGRTVDIESLTVPLPWAEDAEPRVGADAFDTRVTLAKRGPGRMYWRVGMRWVPPMDTIEPTAAGITIDKTLRTEKGPLGEGDTIAHGEMVALDLVLTVNDVLDYVAVDIPLPAGLEAVDTTIGKGRRAMTLRGNRGWWVSHTELRTERALVFADRLTPGAHHHTVFLRAVTSGEYVMPPSKAEAMYYPEVQGNTGVERVVVR